MGIVRTFENFTPPVRFDAIPFTTVQVQESDASNGVFTTIDQFSLVPVDADPQHPQSRDITTFAAVLDPGWYKLLWVDGNGAFFPSDPISSFRGTAPFITTDDLADYLNNPSIVDSDVAGLIVDGACTACRTFTEQTLSLLNDDTIALDGTGTDALRLPELPVISVSEVSVADTVVTDYKLNGSGLLLRTAPALWPDVRQTVSVTYSHGYSNIPADLRVAALTLAARVFQQSTIGTISSETIGSYSVSYSTNTNQTFNLTANEQRILRKYRRD